MHIPIIIIDKSILWDLLQISSPEDIDLIFDQYSDVIECMARNMFPDISRNMGDEQTQHLKSGIILVQLALLSVTINYLNDVLKANNPQSINLISLLLQKGYSLTSKLSNVMNN